MLATRAVQVLIVSCQGVLGWKDANLSMDDLLNSKKNFGRKVHGPRTNIMLLLCFYCFHLKVELCSLGCAPPTSSSGWFTVGNSCCPGQWPNKLCVMDGTGWNLWTIILLFCVSTTWICIKYCVHVPVQLLGWNVRYARKHINHVHSLLPWKSRAFGMSDLKSSKIHMESHTVCHGCKHGGIKTLLVCTVWNLKCTIWHWATLTRCARKVYSCIYVCFQFKGHATLPSVA